MLDIHFIPPEVFTLSEDNIMTQRIAVFLLTAILCMRNMGIPQPSVLVIYCFVSGGERSHRRNAEPDFQKQVRKTAFENLT